MYQVRWHGRGGQGAVTAARILGLAASLHQNYFAQAFPAFGVERRGAPVMAFTKIDAAIILDRSQIYRPDCVVVLDAGLLGSINVTEGLRPGGKVLLNWQGDPAGLPVSSDFDYIAFDATKIALDIIGKPITNTAMVGAFCAAAGFISLTSVQKAIGEALPAHLVEKNILAAEKAFFEVNRRSKNEELAGR